jgi:hypothetical protein
MLARSGKSVARARAQPVRGKGSSHLVNEVPNHIELALSFPARGSGHRAHAEEDVMELMHYRKDAKQLLRGFRAGEPEPRRSAYEALGERAHERFQLTDAHVVATEHGYSSCPQLKHALEHAEPDRPVERIGLQPVSFYEERTRELIAAADERRDSAIRRVRAHVPSSRCRRATRTTCGRRTRHRQRRS